MAAPASSRVASFLSPLTSPPVSTAQLAQEPLPAPSCGRPGLLCRPGGAGGWRASGRVAGQAPGRTGVLGRGQGGGGGPSPRAGLPAHGMGPLLHLEMPARPLWAWSPCGQKAPLLVKLCLPKRDAGGRAGTYGFRFLQFGAGAAESGDVPGSEADILTPDFAGLYLRARSAPSPRDLARYRENTPFTGGRQAQRGQVTFLGLLSRQEMEPKHPSDRTHTHTQSIPRSWS